MATVRLRDAVLEAVEADLAPWCGREPVGAQVPRLATYRGVTRMGGLCLAAEVFDWRRFPRARPFMSFTGLVPSEHSTGKRQHRGSVGVGIRQRQADVRPATVARSWDAQVRLSERSVSWRPTATCALSWPPPALESFAGFLWAEMVAED